MFEHLEKLNTLIETHQSAQREIERIDSEMSDLSRERFRLVEKAHAAQMDIDYLLGRHALLRP